MGLISTTPTKQVGKSGKMSYFDKPIYSIPQVTEQGLQEFKEYFLGINVFIETIHPKFNPGVLNIINLVVAY